MTTTQTSAVGRQWRPLGLTWLAVAVPVAMIAYLLAVVSDHRDDRTAGLVLLVLVVAAVALGAWMLAAPSDHGRTVSLLGSLMWLVGAAVVLPTQDFLVDAILAAGIPAAGALLTAAVAWRTAGRRPTHR